MTDIIRLQNLTKTYQIGERQVDVLQAEAGHDYPPDYLGVHFREGEVGSVLNVVDVDVVNELQRIAVEESRLGKQVVRKAAREIDIPLDPAVKTYSVPIRWRYCSTT